MTGGDIKTVFQQVLSGRRHVVWSLSDGRLLSRPPVDPGGILPGSFNPLHAGHVGLREAAERVLGAPVFYELSITNAEKPPLDLKAVVGRRDQFRDRPLALTDAPTFAAKANLFPGVTFVVGIDTAERILDVRFYGGRVTSLRQSFDAIRASGCRFLVAGRKMQDRFLTLADLSIPADIAGLFRELPEREFRSDISSTRLRTVS